jgi:glucose-6-phosphate isomerase
MSTFMIDPGPLSAAFHAALDRLDRAHFANALWTRSPDVWPVGSEARASIAHRLGWLDVAVSMTTELDRLQKFAAWVRDGGFSDVVLLGMGGSSLAPEVLSRTCSKASGFPRFRMLDSTDPADVRDALSSATTSLFILASKSGTTIEPMAMAAEAQRRVEAAGLEPWGSRFVAISDAGTPLAARAQAEGFRELFINPSDIGGRFSALSFFGLVPAAAIGVDVEALLSSVGEMSERCRETDSGANPGLALGALMAAGADAGRDKMTLVLPAALEPLGLWIEQLVAESTGKSGVGIVPVAGEADDSPLGPDRLGIVLRTSGEDGVPSALENRLIDAGAPAARLFTRPSALGGEFLRWEVATTAAGWLLNVNPFDQPNVGQAKAATSILLKRFEEERSLVTEPVATFELSDVARDQLPRGDPAHFLRLARPGDYVAMLAYVPSSSTEWGSLLSELRNRVARTTGCASTLGYGPRYLHSTGQLHKGGANNGLFLVLAPESGHELPVPGAPYSFGTLQQAQALGDFESLHKAGRRALLVTFRRGDMGDLERRLDEIIGGA